MKGVIIAGTHSGVGKTTVAIGVMAALKKRGLKVQPFKIGPDYIDPTYHEAVCGLPSRNLDSWLLEPQVLAQLFHRAMAGKTLAIIEGVMGLYDGRFGGSEEGSTAQVAKLLDLPVVLVVDASGSARSAAATALGFRTFDPQVKLAGVILNGIASRRHLELVAPALEQVGIPILGYLPRRPDLVLPQRHLGLIPAIEGPVAREFFHKLGLQVEATIDLDRFLGAAAEIGPPPQKPPLLFPPRPRPKRVAIAVARDRAFHFYYPDALELLESWGAELVPFSPLEDSTLPKGVHGVYIGGGFPELYAPELSSNLSMRRDLQEAFHRGMPIYAECGGLMYLGQGIEDLEGRRLDMVGLLPVWSSMKDTSLTLGYRTVRALEDNLLLSKGDAVPGHEFHWSTLQPQPSRAGTPPVRPAYEVAEQPGRHEGFRAKGLLASYIHVHLGSRPYLAPNFIRSCWQWRHQGIALTTCRTYL